MVGGLWGRGSSGSRYRQSHGSRAGIESEVTAVIIDWYEISVRPYPKLLTRAQDLYAIMVRIIHNRTSKGTE